MRAAIYIRTCSDNQQEEGFKDQISACIKYAELKNFTVDPKHIYSDTQKLKSPYDRPGFKNLMESAWANLFDVVIVDNLSRISRYFAQIQILVKELKFAGIPLLSVNDNTDTSNEESKLSCQLKVIINETFLNDVRTKTLRGQSGQKDRGFLVRERVFGYKSEPVDIIIIDKNGRPRLEGYKMIIVDHEAKIVKRIFKLFANGLTVSGIVKDLNQNEAPCINSAKKRWDVSTVLHILRNEKYIGVWLWGKLQNKRHPLTGVIRKVPRAKGALHVSCHLELRIIPEELWEQVQAILIKRSSP